MNEAQEYMRHALALPLAQQRDALWPGYVQTYAAYGRDWDVNTATIADDYEFSTSGPGRILGFEKIRGPEEYVREHRRLLEELDVERVELDDVRPLGDGRVVTFIRLVIRAGGGTIEQQALDYHEFRDGLLTRQVVYFDREEGLRELGL